MLRGMWYTTWVMGLAFHVIFSNTSVCAQVLKHRQQLESYDFWDNRDFDWYEQNIPFFECADTDIALTYYYRWDLLTKHLTYSSPNHGYVFTEFIDRPFWSGAYGAISCPAGHQLYEARWLRSPRIANDYSRYYFRTPGAQPRNYSTWLADAVWATHLVHPNKAFVVDLLPDLIGNYEGWEKRHFVPEVGLFWQTGHDDGMEFNINSRQTQDILRGAPSYRPSFNAYMWADATAIANIARLAGQAATAERFEQKAASIKAKMFELMWDERRQFFFPLLKNAEERDGYHLQPLTRTYESGKHAGDPRGRELIGYVPWQFNMLKGPTRYDIAWKKLIDRDGFDADFGPSTVERNDPMFLLQKSCCWWSGQSWPYATTQTLKALANALQSGSSGLSNSDYVRLLGRYARSHRKDGKPYLAEALHPDTGSFEGHDGYNHSEHYFHSGYCDLIITGLAGLVPRDDDDLEIRPLAPSDWDYFALEAVPYRGHLISIVWDKDGQRYMHGPGLHIFVDGQPRSNSPIMQPITIRGAVPKAITDNPASVTPASVRTNFVVNNDGDYYPRVAASFTSPDSSVAKINDGNYWYLLHPPNRWTCAGTPNAADWLEVDFGTPRTIDTVRAYLLDDRSLPSSSIAAPQALRLEYWHESAWKPVNVERQPQTIEGGRPHAMYFSPLQTTRLRLTLVHREGKASGLTELEAWGEVSLPIQAPPHPSGNLAFNPAGNQAFPKATASYHDRFGGLPKNAIDGKTNFLPTPVNRWTSYESPNESDWLQIEFAKPTQFRRVDLAIYDDRGGVQSPTRYDIEYWREGRWEKVSDVKRSPESPAGGQWNSIRFAAVESEKMRIVMVNRNAARSGLSEVMVWNEE